MTFKYCCSYTYHLGRFNGLDGHFYLRRLSSEQFMPSLDTDIGRFLFIGKLRVAEAITYSNAFEI